MDGGCLGRCAIDVGVQCKALAWWVLDLEWLGEARIDLRIDRKRALHVVERSRVALQLPGYH